MRMMTTTTSLTQLMAYLMTRTCTTVLTYPAVISTNLSWQTRATARSFLRVLTVRACSMVVCLFLVRGKVIFHEPKGYMLTCAILVSEHFTFHGDMTALDQHGGVGHGMRRCVQIVNFHDGAGEELTCLCRQDVSRMAMMDMSGNHSLTTSPTGTARLLTRGPYSGMIQTPSGTFYGDSDGSFGNTNTSHQRPPAGSAGDYGVYSTFGPASHMYMHPSTQTTSTHGYHMMDIEHHRLPFNTLADAQHYGGENNIEAGDHSNYRMG